MEHVIETHSFINITIGGKSVPFITDAVVATWIIMAALIIAALLLTRKLEAVPKGGQSAAEAAIEFMQNFLGNQLGRLTETFTPYLTTVMLFLLASNMISIINIIPSGSFLAWLFKNPELSNFNFSLHPPTKNFNVTLCLAVMTIFVVLFAEFKYLGFKGWLHGFFNPTPINGFIKILDYIVRPLSLCLRLFGNIMGGFIVMTLIYSVAPIIAPAAVSMYFDLFDGALQAYVFVFLSSLYIGEVSEEMEAHNLHRLRN